MAISLGLRRGDYKRYINLLASPHAVVINIMVLDLEDRYLARIGHRLLDGQVDIDTTREITRSASLELLDPEAQLNFDTESPTAGALYMDRQIYIVYTVAEPDYSWWVDVPIFRGPITKLDRNHDVLSIECQGKEIMAMNMAWKAKTFTKGWRRARVIDYILRHFTGEKRTDIRTGRGPRLPKRYSTSRTTVPWEACQKQARAGHDHLFYDGRGWARLRAMPNKSVFTFRSGRGGVVKNAPQAGYDTSNLKNVVWVQGKAKSKGKGKNKKERTINVVVSAGRRHPLSPWRLGRNGVPQRFVEHIKDDSIRTKKAARKKARAVLRSKLIEYVDVQFDSVPIPHLEENDVCRVSTPEFAASFRLRKMSIPLLADGSSTIGYNRRLTPSKARIRRR